jgi:hypothetical protein
VQAARRHLGEVAARLGKTVHSPPAGTAPRPLISGYPEWPSQSVSVSWPRNPADFAHPECIARRTCATRVRAARRHPGAVAARRRSRMRPPSAHRAPPSALRRSRRRTMGGGRRNAPPLTRRREAPEKHRDARGQNKWSTKLSSVRSAACNKLGVPSLSYVMPRCPWPLCAVTCTLVAGRVQVGWGLSV